MNEDNFLKKVSRKVTGVTKEDEDEAVLKAKVGRWWETDRNARKTMDWKWFMYDLWVNGYHYAKYDRNTQQIITGSKDDGHAKVTINKVRTTLRAVRNYTVRNRPKAEVTPSNLTQDTLAEAVKVNKYLDFLHDKLGLRRKIKGTVWHALKYSVGFWQVLWNPDADDGQGEIEINEIDPYDIYWQAGIRSPREAQRVTLAIDRPIVELISVFGLRSCHCHSRF